MKSATRVKCYEEERREYEEWERTSLWPRIQSTTQRYQAENDAKGLYDYLRMTRIPLFIQDEVFRKHSDYKCVYCGMRCSKQNPYTIDHIVPLKRGGTHDLANLTLSCRSCNSSKRDRLLSEWSVKS